MEKKEQRVRDLSLEQLSAVKAGSVPVLPGKPPEEAPILSQALSELGLTTVEQQG